ncbi:MAG: FimV/HubP family polar landmark protein [Gammaproteobacteria bacterium]
MVRKIAFSVWLALLIVPFSAQGLGLGEITLNSALNQPLDADIELLSVEQQDLATLKATMASHDLFARYGLDRASFLSSISLDVRSQPGGRHVIHVSSNRSITEPFVTMLIELNWRRGRMLREYTVLLDPPVFAAQPAQPAPTPVAPTPRATTGTIVRVPGPIAEPEPEAEPEYRQPAMPSTLPAAERPGEYMVQRHDTLWELSRDMRPAGTEINQMMIAMFRANPDAFYGNINRLKAGVILRIPDSVEMADINRAAANDEVRRQMAEWRGGSYFSGVEDSGRLRLVPADSSSVGGAGAAGADEALTQALADQTTENLLLREQIEDLSGRIDDQERLLQLRDTELARLQSQAAAGLAADDTQVSIDDAATTAGPEDVADAVLADDAGVETSDATADVVADTAADTTADTSAADTSTTTRPVPTVVTRPRSSPSLMERAIDLAGNQWLWIGLGVVVLTMGGLVFARRRREESVLMEAIVADELYESDGRESTGTARIQTIKLEPDDSFVVEESVAPDVDPFADTIAEEDEKDQVEVDLESTMPGVEVDLVDLDQTVSGETQINLEGADPLAEADFHMAYGLYDQAADLVQKALDKNPERHEFRNKLAEIFFVWGNKDSFLETVQYLHDNQHEMAEGEWDKIVIMGRQIDPDSHLFAGESGAGAVGVVDMPLEETKVSEVDVDLLMGDEGDEDSAAAAEMTEFDDVFADAADAGDDDLLSTGGDEEEELDVSGLAAAEMGDDANLDAAIGAAADDDDDLEATSQTAELNIDDLGLGDELDATGTMQIVDLEDQEEDVGHGTVQMRNEALQKSEAEGLDFEFDAEDEPAAVDPGKTAEMPVLSMDDVDDDDEEQMFTDVFGDDDESRISDNLDLDIGADFDSVDKDDTLAQTTEMTREMEAVDEGDDLEHTGTMRLPDPAPADATGLHDVTGIHEATIVDEDYTGTIKLPDAESEAETMSEVGTKLDLARAYVDMGDPDGARSILEEVLEEGNEQQKAEAQTLLDSLS